MSFFIRNIPPECESICDVHYLQSCCCKGVYAEIKPFPTISRASNMRVVLSQLLIHPFLCTIFSYILHWCFICSTMCSTSTKIIDKRAPTCERIGRRDEKLILISNGIIQFPYWNRHKSPTSAGDPSERLTAWLQSDLSSFPQSLLLQNLIFGAHKMCLGSTILDAMGKVGSETPWPQTNIPWYPYRIVHTECYHVEIGCRNYTIFTAHIVWLTKLIDCEFAFQIVSL